MATWLLAFASGSFVAPPRWALAESDERLGRRRSHSPAAGFTATPERAPHPEPRVIVTVTAIDGPHDRGAVQRAARESWGGIVRCYKQFGQGRQGAIVLELKISEHGQVSDVQRGDSGDSKLNGPIADCLMRVLLKRTMPAAPSASTATIQIQLAPGND